MSATRSAVEPHAFDALLENDPAAAETLAHALDGVAAGLLATLTFAPATIASTDHARDVALLATRFAALLRRTRDVDPSGPGPDPG